MNCRPHGSKPAIALWMLIAAADLAILVAAIGPLTTLLILAALVVAAAGVAAARLLAAPPRRTPSRIVTRLFAAPPPRTSARLLAAAKRTAVPMRHRSSGPFVRRRA